jgi:metal-responsive CopG/Arc/MetJ family transcriptional regulator
MLCDVCATFRFEMGMTQQIAVRVDRRIKRRLINEVRARRAKGHGVDRSDVMREALIEYFDRRNGKAVAA